MKRLGKSPEGQVIPSARQAFGGPMRVPYMYSEKKEKIIEGGEQIHEPGTYGSVARVPRMANANDTPKAIEPTSIDKMTPEQRFGADMPSAKPVTYDDITKITVSRVMRMMGYTRHPYDCLHYRKRMYLGSKVRECMDCGERV